MKIKTSDLIGPALDWAVAMCEGFNVETLIDFDGTYFAVEKDGPTYQPSIDPAQAYPIIERAAHNLFKHNGGTEWCCACNVARDGYTAIITADGPTPLIAAMRCYVAGKLGDEVEIPEGLA